LKIVQLALDAFDRAAGKPGAGGHPGLLVSSFEPGGVCRIERFSFTFPTVAESVGK
jgi:hypothetical protein